MPTWQQVGPYPQWYDGIDDGSWEQMTKPGAAGYGLIVWQSSMMGCSHEEPVNQIFSRTGWLTPAFCSAEGRPHQPRTPISRWPPRSITTRSQRFHC